MTSRSHSLSHSRHHSSTNTTNNNSKASQQQKDVKSATSVTSNINNAESLLMSLKSNSKLRRRVLADDDDDDGIKDKELIERLRMLIVGFSDLLGSDDTDGGEYKSDSDSSIKAEHATKNVIKQPQLTRQTSISSQSSSNSSINSNSNSLYPRVTIIGFGPSALGVCLALMNAGLPPGDILIVDKGVSTLKASASASDFQHDGETKTGVGDSFINWPNHTRFISPSFNTQGWCGSSGDLNAIEPLGAKGSGSFQTFAANYKSEGRADYDDDGDSEGKGSVNSQHPTGEMYAAYLESVIRRHPEFKKVVVLRGFEVVGVSKLDTTIGNDGNEEATSGSEGFKVVVRNCNCNDEVSESKLEDLDNDDDDDNNGIKTAYTSHVIYCGGEFCHPSSPSPSSSSSSSSSPSLSSLSTGVASEYHYANVKSMYSNGWDGYIDDMIRTCNTTTNTTTNTCNSTSNSDMNVQYIIGSGEAAIDTLLHLLLSSTFVNKNTLTSNLKFTIITTSSNIKNNTFDPSMGLSPITSYRLRSALLEHKGKVNFIFNEAYVKAFKKDDAYSLTTTTTKTTNKTTNTTRVRTRNSSLPIILCTGFNISLAPLLRDLFKFRGGYPMLSLECDESVKIKGVFCCGPVVRHYVKRKKEGEGLGETCKTRLVGLKDVDEEGGGSVVKEEEEEEDEIILCFIYKFRTRFALVAGEIMSRIIVGDHQVFDDSEDEGEDEDERGEGDDEDDDEEKKKKATSPTKAPSSKSKSSKININDKGHTKLAQVQGMLERYKDAGMLVTDLSCVSCKDLE